MIHVVVTVLVAVVVLVRVVVEMPLSVSELEAIARAFVACAKRNAVRRGRRRIVEV